MNNIAALYQEYRERILSAAESGEPLVIEGGGSKNFYGRAVDGDILDTRNCSGVISYEPSELVLTAHAGTPLSEIENTLAGQKQMLAFEPPHFSAMATLGGVVACGLSGPRRPYAGSVRDYVLGVKCVNGRGEILKFGGQVMKNVAGYDVSRVMAGAMGTLGLLLEISIKVQPVPEHEICLAGETDFNTALRELNSWAGQPLSLSAAGFDGKRLHVRLSGKHSAVNEARKKLSLSLAEDDPAYWRKLREHQMSFFRSNGQQLWRLSVPATAPALDLAGEWLIDWGGAQRWLRTVEPMAKIRQVTQQAGGHATLFRGADRSGDVFHPLAPGVHALHVRLKQAFDPAHILNRGRLYRDI